MIVPIFKGAAVNYKRFFGELLAKRERLIAVRLRRIQRHRTENCNEQFSILWKWMAANTVTSGLTPSIVRKLVRTIADF